MSAPAANTSSEPAITTTADLRVGVESLDLGGQLLHQLGREGVAGLGPVQPAQGYVVVDGGLDQRAHASTRGGVIALIPVASRPMISFWICEVPSYSVVTRASRR